MAKVQMNPDEVKSWIAQIEELNKQLDVNVNGAYDAMTQIQTSSSGSVIDNICNYLDEMNEARKHMVRAFGGLVETVVEIASSAASVMGEMEGIIKIVGTVLGL